MPRHDAADIFSSRSDADWEMFRRGAPAERAEDPWSPECIHTQAPVELAPDDARPAETPGAAAAVRCMTAPIVGLPYPNADGTSRREAVRGLRRLDLVRLAHRPDNPVDANAVAVLRLPDGCQLGYLPASLAADVVAGARGRGTRYVALVDEVTGPPPGDQMSVAQPGARLLVLVLENGATKAMAREHLLGLLNRG